MKRILILAFVLISALVKAQTIGIKVAAPIIKNNPIDNTITGYADLLNGGYHIVTTKAGRDSLNTFYTKTLKTGMLAHVTALDSTFKWSGTVWMPFASGVTSQVLADSLKNYTQIQDGLLSGGVATIGAGSVMIATATYRIAKVNYTSAQRTFTGIANSPAGTQYYLVIYGKNNSTLDTISGARANTAVVPTIPANTVKVNTILIGDAGISSSQPDLTGFAKLSGGNDFTGNQKINGDVSLNDNVSGGFYSYKNKGVLADGAYESVFGISLLKGLALLSRKISMPDSGRVITLSADSDSPLFSKNNNTTRTKIYHQGILTFGFGLNYSSPTLKVDTTMIQSKLVSASNIKTVNGNSLLGSGNLVISSSGGTVTNVSALTLGTTGTDLSSTVVNSTTTPVITLNVPTASATNRGVLSSTDWSAFSGKQNAITLTTTGTSGASTLIGATLNVPQYAGTTYTFGSGLINTANSITVDTTSANGLRTLANSRTLAQTQTALNLKQNNISFGAIGSTPNANGGGVASGIITLQPASSSFGGLMSTTTQSFSGNKTFSNQLKVVEAGGFATGTEGLGSNIVDATATSSAVRATARFSNRGSGFITKLILSDNMLSDANIVYFPSLTNTANILGFGVGTTTPQVEIDGNGTLSLKTSRLNLAPATVSISSIRIPTGVAPTTPVTGDEWSLGVRRQTFDGVQTKDVLYDKANSVFADGLVGVIMSDGAGNFSKAVSADRTTSNTQTKTASYTVVLSDVGANGTLFIRADATAGDMVITLPAASVMAGLTVIVKKVDATANVVTISAASIDGLTTRVIRIANVATSIISNGTVYNLTAIAANVPIQLKDFYTDASNTGIVETDLYSYTTLANRFSNNGDKVVSTFTGIFTDATASSQLRVYFAGNKIGDTGALTMSVTGSFIINVTVIRTGFITARASVNVSTPGASTASYTNYTLLNDLDFTSTNILKITGTASGVSGGTGDITATIGNIIFQPAAL